MVGLPPPRAQESRRPWSIMVDHGRVAPRARRRAMPFCMAPLDWVLEPLGGPLFKRLAEELSGPELQSVLLEVMQRRAARRTPGELVRQYRQDGFCEPSPVDLRTSLSIDLQWLEAASTFEAIELSPVAPLGACSLVAPTHQHRVLSALRGTEVVSDPTNVLALECAARMRGQPKASVHLASSQRILRAQPQPKSAGYSQHFRIIVLGSGGVELKEHGFTLQTVLQHIRTALRGLELLELAGYSFGKRRVALHATARRKAVAERIAGDLAALTTVSLLEHPYYSGGLRFQVWVTTPDGEELPLIDGGTFDWLAQLTSNRRAVYVATGVGAQIIALRFAGPQRGS